MVDQDYQGLIYVECMLKKNYSQNPRLTYAWEKQGVNAPHSHTSRIIKSFDLNEKRFKGPIYKWVPKPRT